MGGMNLFKYILEKKCSLLGIGPMSKNCVDVVIELANTYNIPLMLIASRRQIESEKLGRGYVNNWSTEEFVEYVKERDENNKIILCRDHGGPYQSEDNDGSKSIKEVMDNAKESFQTDIESGFNIIHIDPSENLVRESKIDEMLERIFELYDFCYKIAKQNQNEIKIEISIGKEDGKISKFSEIKYAIEQIEKFCFKKDVPLPLFLVVKTGNHVLETENVGMLDDIMNGKYENERREILKIIKYCKERGILIKEHNGDYLSEKTLREHPEIGIDAINVAPEFGVIETRAILSYLSKNNLDEFRQRFLDISFNSKKWKKWMINDSEKSKNDKAVISGHYIFSSNEFQKLKNEFLEKIEDKMDFDNFLKLEIRNSIIKYLKCLKII
jgi:fructose/tagatose bisphosphate aldolase